MELTEAYDLLKTYKIGDKVTFQNNLYILVGEGNDWRMVDL